NFLVKNMTELDRHFAGPFFVWPEERAKIATRSDESRGRSFPIEDGGRKIEAANVARVRGMNVARVAQDDGLGRDSKLFEQLRVPGAREKDPIVRAWPENQLRRFTRHKVVQSVHNQGDACSRGNEGAVMSGMGKVPGNFRGPGAREFVEALPKINFENQLLVVFEVNEKGIAANARELFAKKPDVFARRPGVHDLRRAAIRKNTRPFAIDLVE